MSGPTSELATTMRVVTALRTAGIAADAGRSWDGYGAFRQGQKPIWYCSPRTNGGVLVHCETHGDTIFLDLGDVQPAIERIATTALTDERRFVWETLAGKRFDVGDLRLASALQKLRALASVTPTDLAGWGERLTALYDLRPRPIKKLFGTQGPSPEQAIEYDAERRLHASLLRKARSEHRKALDISNATIRAQEQS